MKRTKKGFTLVELLVVIAILAILASVSVVGYTAFISKANNSVALQELTQIRNAVIAEDITNEHFNLSDGIDATTTDAADKTEADYVAEFIATLGLEGELTYADGVYTYTLNGGEATWTIDTNEVK